MADPPIVAPGETLAAEKLQAFGSELTTYVPTLTAAGGNPTLGSGSDSDGSWYQIGPLVYFAFSIQFGTSGVATGTGQYRVALPVPVLPGNLAKVSLGRGRVIDNNVATDLGSSIIELEMLDGDPTKLIMAVEEAVTIAATVPWTWAASDRIFGSGTYPGDF